MADARQPRESAPIPPASPPAAADPQALYALGSLVAAVRHLSADLEDVARRLHADDGLTLAERALLLQLRRGGNQTIPQLALQRGSTRQYVQQALPPLVERGLVAWLDNPRHRRSRLATLTPDGVQLVRRVLAREGELFAGVSGAIPRADLLAAAATVAALGRELVPAASPAPAPPAAPALRARAARG